MVQCQKQTIIKQNFFVHNIKNVRSIIKRIKPTIVRIKRNCKTTCKKRGIKGYKSMSDDRLLSAVKASESVKKSEKNFDDTKLRINFLNQE